MIVDLSQKVTRSVDNSIKRIFQNKEEVKKYLLNHSTKEEMVRRVCEQIRGAEINQPLLMNEDVADRVIADFTRNYCNTLLECKEKEVRSKRDRELNELLKRDVHAKPSGV